MVKVIILEDKIYEELEGDQAYVVVLRKDDDGITRAYTCLSGAENKNEELLEAIRYSVAVENAQESVEKESRLVN